MLRHADDRFCQEERGRQLVSSRPNVPEFFRSSGTRCGIQYVPFIRSDVSHLPSVLRLSCLTENTSRQPAIPLLHAFVPISGDALTVLPMFSGIPVDGRSIR